MKRIVITLNPDLPTPDIEFIDEDQPFTPREISIVQRTLRVQHGVYSRQLRLNARKTRKEIENG